MNPVSQGTIFLVPGLGGLTMAQIPISSAQSHVLMTSQGITGGMRVQAIPPNAPSAGVTIKMEQDHIKAETPSVDLYLCDTSRDGGTAIAEDSKEQASVELLEQWYQSLLQHKLKDTLSSFLPDVPGDFDSGDVQESMLRTLIDRPPVGGREFMPLSEQVLLGFRLHPGPLPEQFRLDPPVPGGQHHHQHKKKKHKHRYLEKVDEGSIESYPPPTNRDHSPPVDPCSFIRTEHTTNFFHQAPPSLSTTHHAAPMIPVMGGTPMKFMGAANILSQQSMVAPSPPSVIVDRLPSSSIPGTLLGAAGGSLSAEHLRLHAEKRAKKKRHENGGEGAPKKKKKKDKDRKDKDKDRKRKRHHNQDPSHPVPMPLAGSGPAGPPPLILANYPPRTD